MTNFTAFHVFQEVRHGRTIFTATNHINASHIVRQKNATFGHDWLNCWVSIHFFSNRNDFCICGFSSVKTLRSHISDDKSSVRCNLKAGI